MANRVKIYDYREPALEAGTYTLTATQNLVVDGKTMVWNGGEAAVTRNFQFIVQGYQHSIPAEWIHAAYPPAGISGQFQRHFSHIVIKQPTFPWERFHLLNEPAGQKTPWLALFTFTKEDLDAERVKLEMQEIGTGEERQIITVLSIEKKHFQQLKPDPIEMRNLTHVRENDQGEMLAVVLGNRLPVAGKQNINHLVSLENGQIRDLGNRIEVYSLYSWSFICEPQATETQDAGLQLLKNLTSGPIGLPIEKATDSLKPYIQQGFTPHTFYPEKLKPVAAWYLSPLAAGDRSDSNRTWKNEKLTHSGDARYREKHTGWEDMTDALAFALGQMQALNDLEFLRSLYRWKYLKGLLLQQPRQDEFLLNILGRRQVQQASNFGEISELESVIDSWLTELIHLKKVPFHYLMPHSQLLEDESIRFFQLDEYWMRALYEGAISPGSGPTYKMNPAISEKRSGFVLRSALVAGWPDIHLTARDSSGKQLQTVQQIMFAPDTILYLVKGLIAKVEVIQKPESVHFTPFDQVGTLDFNIIWRDAQLDILDVTKLPFTSRTLAQKSQDKGFYWSIEIQP